MLSAANKFNTEYGNALSSLSVTHSYENLLDFFSRVKVGTLIEIIDKEKIYKPEYTLFCTNVVAFAKGVGVAIKASVTQSYLTKNTSKLHELYGMLLSLIKLEQSINQKLNTDIKPGVTVTLCGEVESHLLYAQSIGLDVYNNFLVYVDSLYKYPDHSAQLRFDLETKIADEYRTDLFTRHFLYALIECAALDVVEDLDGKVALKNHIFIFLNQYVDKNKSNGMLGLIEKFDDEFIYLMQQSLDLVMVDADNLLANESLRVIQSKALVVVADIISRSDVKSKRYYAAMILALKFHYPYQLINQDKRYEKNEIFSAHFNLNQLMRSSQDALKVINRKDETARIYFKLIELYKLFAEIVHFKVTNDPISNKNNSQYLNTLLNNFNITNIASELGLRTLTLEQYGKLSLSPSRLYTFNPVGELIVIMQKIFQFLDVELKLRMEKNPAEWRDKFNSLQDSSKEFYQLNAVDFVLDDVLLDVDSIEGLKKDSHTTNKNKKKKKRKSKSVTANNNKDSKLAHDLLSKFYANQDFSQSSLESYFNQMNELLKDESVDLLKLVMHGLMRYRVLDAMCNLEDENQIEIAKVEFISAIGLFVGTMNAEVGFPSILINNANYLLVLIHQAIDLFQRIYLISEDPSLVEMSRDLRDILDQYIKACDKNFTGNIKLKEIALYLQASLYYRLADQQGKMKALLGVKNKVPNWYSFDDFHRLVQSAKKQLDDKSECLALIFDLYSAVVDHYEGKDYFATIKKINFDKFKELIRKMGEGSFAQKDYYLIPNNTFGINIIKLFIEIVFIFLDIFVHRLSLVPAEEVTQELLNLKRQVFHSRVVFYNDMPELENMIKPAEVFLNLKGAAEYYLSKANTEFVDFIAEQASHQTINSTFLDAFDQCVACEAKNDPDLLSNFKSSMFKFMKQYEVYDKTEFNLDKDYYSPFLYLVGRFIALLVISADNLFGDDDLQYIYVNLVKIISMLTKNPHDKTHHHSRIMHLFMLYPWSLLDLNNKYDKEKYDIFFNLKLLNSSSIPHVKELPFLELLNKHHQLMSYFYDKKLFNPELIAKNNHQYLNEIFKKFEIAELERFIKLNPLTKDEYEAFSIISGNANAFNSFQLLIKALNNHLLCLIDEFKEREIADHDQWVEKYTAMLKFAKVFYEWPVVSYAIKFNQTMIDSELTRLAPKTVKKVTSKQEAHKGKNKKSIEPPQSAQVFTQSHFKKNKKKQPITPMQLAIQKAKMELEQEALEKEKLKQKEKKLNLPDYVIDILTKLGENAYLVGGATRDSNPNDYDIVVSGLTEAEVTEKLGANYWVGKKFRIYDIPGSDVRKPIQISMMKETMQLDADGRDFSCNVRYYNWLQNKFYDFHGSAEAIRDKKIKFIGDASQRIIEDSSRIFRAFRLMMDGYLLEDVLTEDHIREIVKLSGDKRHYELMKCLRSDSNNKFFELLNQYDVLMNVYSLTRLESAWCMRRWDMLLRIHPNPDFHKDNDLLALTLMFPSIFKIEEADLKSAEQLFADLRIYGLSPQKVRGVFFVEVILYFLQMRKYPQVTSNNDPYYFSFLVETLNSYYQEVVNHSSVNPNALYGQVPTNVATATSSPQCNQ